MKTCTRCGETKSAGQFRHRRRQCILCVRASQRKPKICAACGGNFLIGNGVGHKQKLCGECRKGGKWCARCEQILPYSSFTLLKKDQKHSAYCKPCQSDQQTELRYGLTRGSLRSMPKVCAICGSSDRRMVIDHDHDTGAIRGVLCSQCNSGLGMFGDDAERILVAAQYILRNFGVAQ